MSATRCPACNRSLEVTDEGYCPTCEPLTKQTFVVIRLNKNGIYAAENISAEEANNLYREVLKSNGTRYDTSVLGTLDAGTILYITEHKLYTTEHKLYKYCPTLLVVGGKIN
jgi:hypothetical protein